MEAILEKKLEFDKSEWKPVKFGDVVREPKESIKDPATAGVEYVVGLEHIEPEDIHLRSFNTLEESTTFTKAFKKGDVLFGRRRAYLKKAALAEFDGICSGDITVFRANENLIPELLPFIVNNEKFFDWAVKHSAGGLSPRVKFKDLAKYKFLLPPKGQQAQFAELLWAMDDVIGSEIKLKNSQEDLINSLQIELFMGKRRLHNLIKDYTKTKIGSIPKDWEIKTIGDICEVKGGKRLPKGYSLQEADNGHKYITVSDMNYFGIDSTKIKYVPEEVTDQIKRYRVNQGDIYISVAGTIGLVGMVPEKLNGAYLTENADKLTNVKINKEYLMLLMRSSIIQNQVESSKTINAQPKLALTRIRNFLITVPNEEEQEFIAVTLKEANAVLESIKSKLSSSKILQKNLINQIF